ncbi:MAG: Zn-dependent hydrolase, partial [Alphaproteobacteria bacterium]|nr:Zn-dependent hydrolase [Alphaproteobacteria bacterium]
LEARDHPRIFVGLGNDALLASEGVTATGMDWGQHVRLTPDVEIISARNHHWGGRWGVDRTRALWSAFIIKTPHGNIFFAGDTGPGDMKWPQDAAASGPVRLALIPIGAFRFAPGQMVNGNHIGPMDAVRVFGGLGAAFAIPIHWGTFHLSGEAYDTPPKMLSAFAACAGLSPNAFRAHSIGEPVEVPLLGASAPAPFNDVAIGKCADSPQVRALP